MNNTLSPRTLPLRHTWLI